MPFWLATALIAKVSQGGHCLGQAPATGHILRPLTMQGAGGQGQGLTGSLEDICPVLAKELPTVVCMSAGGCSWQREPHPLWASVSQL